MRNLDVPQWRPLVLLSLENPEFYSTEKLLLQMQNPYLDSTLSTLFESCVKNTQSLHPSLVHSNVLASGPVFHIPEPKLNTFFLFFLTCFSSQDFSVCFAVFVFLFFGLIVSSFGFYFS